LSKKKVTEKPTKVSTSTSPMDVRLLEQIVKMMAVNDLNAVELRDGEKRITLKRGPATSSGPIYHTLAPSGPTHAAPPPAPAAAPVVDEDAGLTPIKSPMVGTFYSAGSPDAKPFVQVGSTIDDETDVCIIEAMKVFNNIKAETSGTIAKILVTNGQTVEFGQILFLVKP
jgi:acetyl-CoA carboxylase biotin carboxyl carrier protein